MAAKNQKNSEKGQALFEFLIFLPFTFVMITVFITMGNSINGAINQQKLLRGYFYYDIKNNSYAPSSYRIYRWKTVGISRASMSALGWKMKSDPTGQYPIAPCYKLNPILTGPTEETCEDTNSIKKTDDPSAFVRIYTVYGICATPYQYLDNGQVRFDHDAWAACALKTN